MNTSLSHQSTAPSLDYAQRPHEGFRRVARRVAIVLTLALVAVLLIRFGPAGVQRMNAYVAQQRCANYSVPAGTVVFDGSVGNTGRVPKCWSTFYPAVRSDATVFLHEMYTPGGRRQLVAVDLIAVKTSGAMLIARTFEMGTFARPAREIYFDNTSTILVKSDAKIFAGQLDPSNPSQFVIELIQDGKHRTIDGWIGEGGYVTFEQRDKSDVEKS